MGNVDSALGQLQVDRDKGEVFEDWMMAPGELGGTPVTVFSAAHPPTSRKRPYIERALQASRVYRHPGLLKYLDGGIIGGEVVIVTERATPLLHHDLSLFSPLHVSAGLLSIIDTLVFLHDRAGVSHNNISSSGIFITAEGAWKLWGLEYSCSFGELTRDHIEHINSYCQEKCIPPDDKTRISPAYQHARDSYAFSQMVQDILSPDVIAEIAGAEDFLSVIKEKGLNKDWSQRPCLGSLSKHHMFSHDFLKIHDNLTNILLLNDQKREEFLQNVGEQLRNYPEELVSSTLAGALLSRPLLLHPAAVTYLVPMVLTPKTSDNGGLFSRKAYEKDIVPQILRLFRIHDATVRSVLLLYLPQYVHLIPKDILAEDILPELLLGIKDSSDTLVMSTLHALAYLVPILGANTVIGENRQNLFTTAKPKAAAVLPVNKILQPLTGNSLEARLKSEKLKLKSSDISKESEPPPPPPRSISLVPESLAQDIKSIITPLDNLPLTISHIPEPRGPPDGGEDINSTSNLPGLLPDIACSDNEAWSDWEEMQDTPSEDFSNVLLSLNQDQVKDNSLVKGSTRGMNFMKPKEALVKSTVRMEKNDSSWENDCGTHNVSNSGKASSSMKLDSGQIKGNSDNFSIKQSNFGLGEEYDVLAIKVNKKHDEELDLFADIVPKFDTKKYDLERMLLEANSKTQGFEKKRSPSLSETLAGLDISSTDIGDAWGDDEWGEQVDCSIESRVMPRSTALSNGKDDGELPFNSTATCDEFSSDVRDIEIDIMKEEMLCNITTTKAEKNITNNEGTGEWDNWGDDF